MKKTFLYLFFVIVLISLVSANLFLDLNVTPDLSQELPAEWEICLNIKSNDINNSVNITGLQKFDVSTFSYCEIFDTNFTFLSNGSFSGNNCFYNNPPKLIYDIPYYICVFETYGLGVTDSYKTIDIYPFIDTYITITNTTYSTDRFFSIVSSHTSYLESIGGIYYELSFVPEIPLNITQNITTTTYNFDVISESMNFGVFWIIILFAWIFPFIILGIFRNKDLLDQGAVISMIIFSLMIVFLYSFKYVDTTLRFFTTIFLLFGIIFFALLINEEISITKKEN